VRQLPGWLNEGVAHACEYDLYPRSLNLSRRISNWKENTGLWPLIAPRRNPFAASARGPERAVGLFFARFLIERGGMRELVQRAIHDSDAEFMPGNSAFPKVFHEWTVWMATQRDCNVCSHLPMHAANTDVVLAGTAARWFTATTAGLLEVDAAAAARLLVTEIDASESIRCVHHTSCPELVR